jgi:predicted hotdog family 3-hydroxylacyl-ACP dehydratase
MKPMLTLDRAAIAARVPHSGRMCLLDQVLQWDAVAIHCSSGSHRAADHPMRSASGLLAPCAIEYAAQAMALHGALTAAEDAPPRPGMLVSVRGVRLAVARLDLIEADLQVHAQRLAGDGPQALYAFSVRDEQGAALVEGRALVWLGDVAANPPKGPQ